MRLVMFGTGPFAAPTFRALFDTPHEVVGLVTQPPRIVRGKVVTAATPVRDEAERRGTPIFDPLDVNAAEAQTTLAAWQADAYVVADYGQILSLATLGLARLGAINLHGSLLPKYRGAAPINWAIYHGEAESGVSVIHMTPRVDAGPVLAQAATPIGADEDAVELEVRLSALGAPLVCGVLDQLESGTVREIPQDLALATRARRLRKTDGAIDWSRSAREIKNQVRALQPWPRAYTDIQAAGGEPLRLIIGQVEVRQFPQTAEPGTILVAQQDELLIAAGEGAVAVRKIQSAGRQMMAVANFLNGYPLRPGERLQTISPVGEK